MEIFKRVLDCLPEVICIIDIKTKRVQYVNQTFSTQLVDEKIILYQELTNDVIKSTDHSKYNEVFERTNKANNFNEDVILGNCNTLSRIGSMQCKHILLHLSLYFSKFISSCTFSLVFFYFYSPNVSKLFLDNA